MLRKETSTRRADGNGLMAWTESYVLATLIAGLSVVGSGNGAVAHEMLVGRSEFQQPPPNQGQRRTDRDTIRVSASGRALDAKGRPVVGATVYLRELALIRLQPAGPGDDYTDILGQVKTDGEGRFAFRDVAVEPMKLSPSNIYRHPWNIVVVANGYGAGWHICESESDRDLEVILLPDAQLRGRLIDARGSPVAGVRVQISSLDEPFLAPRGYVHDSNQLQLWWSRLPLATVTDSQGRFTLRGVPTQRLVGLLVDDARFTPKWLSCATIDKDMINFWNSVEL
jgi:hypothetical protein